MGTITSDVLNTSNTLTAREKDFAFQFERQWDLLQQLLGIVRLVKKEDGAELAYYEAERVGNLNVETGEGTNTTGTEYQVKKAGAYTITLERFEKSTTAQAVLKWGVDLALVKTDDEFLADLQYLIQDRLYSFLKLGTLLGKKKTFLSAVAGAKGAVLNRAAAEHKRITEIVGFMGITDLYDYLGEQTVTIQTAFGLQYVENFLGFKVVFLLPDTILSGKIIATPINNIVGYYVDPADEGLKKLGLEFTTTGETNLIGVHMTADYKAAVGSTFAVMGITLFAERIDFISVITIDASASDTTVAVEDADNMADGSPAKGVSDGKRKSS